ncbi:MAG: tetratricopeptide repeat protein [Bacteroidaceae bacterium]|nr:tetratricopeptide repeat protein [Bacteroidaceae bacterium]
MKCICYRIILFCLLAACARPNREQQRLVGIDSLTEVDADSARVLLRDMPVPKVGGENWAYYQLLRVKADDKAWVKHTSDSIISSAATYFEQDNRSGHLAEAYYYMGRVYSDTQNGERALLYFQKALLEDSVHVTNRLRSRIYAQMGYVYLRNGLFDEAVSMQQLAHYFCKLEGDTLGMRYSEEDIKTITMMAAQLQTDSAAQGELRMKIKNVNEQVKNQMLRKKYSHLQAENRLRKLMVWPACLLVAIALVVWLFYFRKKTKASPAPVHTKRQFYDSEISQLLKTHIINNKILKADDWKLIESRLQESFPTFRDSLYSLYSLSETEYRICMLIKLEVSPSNMAKLMATATSTISQSRLRMQQKVFGGQGTAKDWDKYILSL